MPGPYYWVGGTGNWSDATNHWATSSGGTPNAANVPTSADDVYFDTASSGSAYQVTMTTGAVAKSVNISGPASGNVTIAAGTIAFSIYGSLIIASTGVTITSSTVSWTFASTSTGNIVQVGITLPNSLGFVFNGAGGGWTLGASLVMGTSASSSITVTQGTFSTDATNNYAITAGNMTSASGATTRTLSLNASVVTLVAIATFGFGTTTQAGLTFNAGTSSLVFSGQQVTFNGNGRTFYDVSFTRASNDTHTINGANTFNNFSVSPSSSNTVCPVVIFAANQTINGTFTSNSSTATNRAWFQSSVLGTARTITAAAISLQNVDFQDITASSTWNLSAQNCGDCGGNTSITFPASKTVYWNLSGSQYSYATGWCTSSGGTPAVANYPLAQDVAVFDNTGSITSFTLNNVNPVATYDMSARTSAMTFAIGGVVYVFGSLKYGTGVTVTTASSNMFFRGRGTYDITSNGVTSAIPITVDNLNGTVRLTDALNIGSRTFTVTSGNFTTQNNNITAGGFDSSNNNTRSITLGSSTITVTGSAGFSITSTVGLTFNSGTSTIVLAPTGTTTTILYGAGAPITFYNVVIGGTSTGTVTLRNAFKIAGTISSTRTYAYTIQFISTGVLDIANWTISGSAGAVVTMNILSGFSMLNYTGTSYVSVDYLNLTNIKATPTDYRWFAGTNSTNGGGNTGWWFSAPVTTPNFLMMFQ